MSSSLDFKLVERSYVLTNYQTAHRLTDVADAASRRVTEPGVRLVVVL